MIYKATDYVEEGEGCLRLSEENLLTPDSKERHRYEVLIVIRDDQRAEYRRDMGKTSDFTADPINIIGGFEDNGERFVEETVGSLRELAYILRTNPTFDKKELPTLSKWQDAEKKIVFN